MLIPAADLKPIPVPMDSHSLDLHYFLEVYLLLVMGAQLIGLILPPAIDAILCYEHGMIVATGNGQDLFVLELGEDMGSDGLVAAPSDDPTLGGELDGEFGLADFVARAAGAFAAGGGDALGVVGADIFVGVED